MSHTDAQGQAGGTFPLGKVPSGIEGLDTILKGGFLQGGITIVQGKPGAGKTILGNQLCFNHIAAGGRALYVTLLAESHSRMLLHIGGLAFFRGAVIPDQLSYLSAFPVLETEGVRGLLKMLRQEVRAHAATILILDGLVAAEKAAGSDMEFKKFIHELQAQASMNDCAMFLMTSSGDDHGITTAEHTMVDCVIEMNSRLHGWHAERDLEVLKRRGDGFLRGRHAFRIDDEGITVFPRFETLFDASAQGEGFDGEKISAGLDPLDQMLHGGLVRCSSTLLVGPTGSGKTTFGLHFLGGCTLGEPGLFFSFYEARAGIQAKARALGFPLPDHLRQGIVEFLWQPVTETMLDESCAKLIAAVRARGVRRLFLDGLGGLMRRGSEPDRLQYVVTGLVNELRALQVTSLITRESDDLLGGLEAFSASRMVPNGMSGVTDNILLLQFTRQRARLHRSLMVFKSRDSRKDDHARLFEITDRGIVLDATPDRTDALFAETAIWPGRGESPPGAVTRGQRGD